MKDGNQLWQADLSDEQRQLLYELNRAFIREDIMNILKGVGVGLLVAGAFALATLYLPQVYAWFVLQSKDWLDVIPMRAAVWGAVAVIVCSIVGGVIGGFWK